MRGDVTVTLLCFLDTAVVQYDPTIWETTKHKSRDWQRQQVQKHQVLSLAAKESMLWSDTFASNKDKHTGSDFNSEKTILHFDFPSHWKISFSLSWICQRICFLLKSCHKCFLLFDLLKMYSTLVQSVANLPPSGESLKILARDLGSRVYTKYFVQQKHQSQTLEKLGNIYNAYTDLLAKDTKVEKPSCICNFCVYYFATENVSPVYLYRKYFCFVCLQHCAAQWRGRLVSWYMCTSHVIKFVLITYLN